MTTILIILFVLGYLFIALEHNTGINKAAPALLTGVLCWTFYILMADKPPHDVVHELTSHIGELSGILFFLMGAMTIVELVDAHEGFSVITTRINTNSKTKLLWITSFIAFFLSAVLDNLTTTIVMISILRKLVKNRKQRLFFASMVVISANAGGAWSPIGDVTTTMLWIEDRISTAGIISALFIPSVVCTIVPLTFATLTMPGGLLNRKAKHEEVTEVELTGANIHFKHTKVPVSDFEKTLVFVLGIGALLFVPIFKTITHLPPFMGIYLGLGVLWVATEIMHKKKNDEDKDPLSVIGVLRKIDVPSVLFFFGILVAISSLQATGVLKQAATLLDQVFGNLNVIALTLGVLSSIVDNVPLVAAAIGMYDVTQYPIDHPLWELLAYTTGTGGSILIIGSAAGVAAMGMEKIEFGWYAKNVAWLAALGYFAGAFLYILMQ